MVKGRENRTEFVGLMVSVETEVCIRLQSLIQGISKSAVVRNILQDHIQDAGHTVENLTQRYARYLYSQWELRYKEMTSFKKYMEETEQTLLNVEHLNPDLIISILAECRELQRSHLANK